MGDSQTNGEEYVLLEHTADVGFKVAGATLEELFRRAAMALLDIMLEAKSVSQRQSFAVEASGDDAEELLVSWLEEILFAFEARGFAAGRAEVQELADERVRGVLYGEPFSVRKHGVRQVVKAVTYHDLKIVRTDEGYEVSVILDV